MDWATDRFSFTHRDLALFQYEEREATVVHRSASEFDLKSDELTSESQWNEWLKTRCPKDPVRPGICTIICPRAEGFSEDEPSPASYIPFSQSTFQKIVSKFRIHRTIARTITRNVAYFSSAVIQHEESTLPSLVFTCRSTSSWAGDLAMAATYEPSSRTTFAVFFGCNKKQRTQIIGRLATAEPAALAHPMLLPGIFAELERKRLTGLLEDTLDRFTLRTGDFSALDGRLQNSLHMSDSQMHEYLEICYESQNIGREFKCVKRQLSKMAQFCDDLNTMEISSKKFIQSIPTTRERQEMINFNLKIKQRTLEIVDEYDNKVDTCGMVLDNTSITMQTIWNHIAQKDAKVNTDIALDSKQDNAQMRSIALLTMIYLPVSAVASIFSMSIFNWAPEKGLVSKYIWVFFVVSVLLTALTVAIWYCSTSRTRQKEATAAPVVQEPLDDIEAARFTVGKSFRSEMSSTIHSWSFKIKK
ncbi:hypothetical protein B0T10DRAFT_492693 [Thelonectria olida]|uniref:Uncharacterized protein n=1 Tax=Thelonectria olida TaxID=1576542 RepID=A0A9P8VZG7_9HYPO|nr:hypothetical protein B0T10DRAFT_492693 [Thelonectria olida]